MITCFYVQRVAFLPALHPRSLFQLERRYNQGWKSNHLPLGSCGGFAFLAIFFKLFPQTSVVLSPGQASFLITASQFRHDIVAMAFCHGTGTASAALLISRSLTWIVQSFLFGMSFWNNCHPHLFFHSDSPESWLQKSSRRT